MKVTFEDVIDGVNRYINKEIYKGLNGVQEFVARIVIGRVNQNSDLIKNSMMTNGFIKTLGVIDSNGMVEIDQILHDVKKEIERNGVLEFEVPMIGKMRFTPEDVDVLKNEILRGQNHENY
jgi:hypothetical protein